VLAALVNRVTRRMRRSEQAGRTVVLRLRLDDFTRLTRSRTLPRPTAASEPVLVTANALLRAAQPVIAGRGLTLIGVTVTRLEPDVARQLTLALDRVDRAALDAALDDVRERYGPQAITRATLVNSEPSLSAWLLPGEGST
jgi:DNA polymerase-4